MLARIVILSILTATLAIAATPSASAAYCGQTIFPISETVRVCGEEVAREIEGAEGLASDVIDWAQCEILDDC